MTKRIAIIAGIVLAFGATAVVAVAIWPDRAGESGSTSTQPPTSTRVEKSGTTKGSGRSASTGVPAVTAPDIGTAPLGVDTRFALQPVTGRLPVRYRFKHPPLAGVLFDVKTGRVLWQRHPRLEHPIASLTKMMTALMVADRNRPGERVRISEKAAYTPGSAAGLLPRGTRATRATLLQAR